jgi:2-polyprenyl-6-methoxyphenol hydroxylase-like FAD-dependent oxidoreductase
VTKPERVAGWPPVTTERRAHSHVRRAADGRTALIVGAGIGGLSAGLALRQAAWTVRIFERATSPRELGFGLALAPSAIAALGQLGVADVVLARAFTPSLARIEVRRMAGTVVKRAEFPVRDALGGPVAVALRPALHGALLDAVGLDAISTNSSTAIRLRSGDMAE